MSNIEVYKGGQLLEALKSTHIKEEKSRQINEFLLKTYFLLGISETNRPKEKQQTLLIEAFKVEFAHYTLKEIDIAFSLARKGLLQKGKKILDLNLYDKPFSIQYVSELMVSYKEYRKTHSDYIHHKRLPEETEPSKQEQYNVLKKGLYSLWHRFKGGEDIRADLGWYLYTTLYDYHDLFNPSIEAKFDAMKRCVDLLKAKKAAQLSAKKNHIASMSVSNQEQRQDKARQQILFDDIPKVHTEDELKNKAKELLMWEFFKNLKELGDDLELPLKI